MQIYSSNSNPTNLVLDLINKYQYKYVHNKKDKIPSKIYHVKQNVWEGRKERKKGVEEREDRRERERERERE
jgi:hypothetical protein